MTFALRPNSDLEVRLVIEGGPSLGPRRINQNTTVQMTAEGLSADSDYHYHLEYRTPGEAEFSHGPEWRFHTQRASGNGFTFFVQGDSHPERVPKMNVPELYERTLNSVASQKPDFMVCLGDDFSVDTLPERTQASVLGVYLKQVPYLGLVGHDVPVFLVNGNHEQAAQVNLNGTADALGVWAQTSRNTLFAQPAPDAFYSGDTERIPNIGLLRDYYAWRWGDALFVVIDPYWHSPDAVDNRADGGKKNRDLWGITLGDAQYAWLKQTLESSNAKYKFVFAHHVLGTGRGGIERATSYEWGDASPAFKSHRPSWPMPIHQLFVKTGVTIFFQGHDHIFCKQVLDGVIYQSCPVPADVSNQLINGDAYITGDKVVGAGEVKVTVSTQAVKVEFLRSFLPEAETGGHKHGEVAYSYEVNSAR